MTLLRYLVARLGVSLAACLLVGCLGGEAHSADSSDFHAVRISLVGDIVVAATFPFTDTVSQTRRLTSILDSVRNSGRYFARLDYSHATVQAETLVVFYRVSVGPVVTIKTVAFPGAMRTTVAHLHSVANLRAGDTLTPQVLSRAQSFITHTAYLRSAGETRVISEADIAQAVLEIPILERPVLDADGAMGYGGQSATGGLTGSANVQLTNFLGDGRSARLAYERLPGERVNAALVYSQPTTIIGGILHGGSLRGALSARRRGDSMQEWTLALDASGMRNTTTKLGLGIEFSERGGSVGTRDSRVYRLSARLIKGYSDDEFQLFERAQPAAFFRSSLVARRGLARFRSGESYAETRWEGDLSSSIKFGANASCFVRGQFADLITSNSQIEAADYYTVGGARRLRGYAPEQFSVERFAVLTIQPERGLGQTSGYVFLDIATMYRGGSLTKKGYGMGLRATGGSRTLSIELAWGEIFRLSEARLYLGINSSRFLGSF